MKWLYSDSRTRKACKQWDFHVPFASLFEFMAENLIHTRCVTKICFFLCIREDALNGLLAFFINESFL